MGFHIPKSKHKDMRNFEVGISLEHFIINLLLQKSKNMLWIFNEFFFSKFQSYTDPFNVRNCYLVGLNDLDGSQSHVQDVQAAYLNDLIEIGVTGMYEN